MDPTPAPQPQEKAFDVAELKSLLNLPETSTDIELIQALLELIYGLQQKYDAVLADAVALEDMVKNRDLSDFSDIISDATRPFWETQFLTNRENAIKALSEIRSFRQAIPNMMAAQPSEAPVADPVPVPAPVPARIPLRNREPAAPRTVQQIVAPDGDESRAVKILNRANALLRDEGIGFFAAFRKAEQEITQPEHRSNAMQTNVQEGAIRLLAGEDLTDKEGYLVVMTHDSGVPEVKLPTHISDHALWCVDNEGEDGDYVDVLPLNPNKSIRLKLDSTCSPGDVLVNAEVTSHAGMVRKLPSTAGTYRGIAIALETGVDGQEVLCRPANLGNITVV